MLICLAVPNRESLGGRNGIPPCHRSGRLSPRLKSASLLLSETSLPGPHSRYLKHFRLKHLGVVAIIMVFQQV